MTRTAMSEVAKKQTTPAADRQLQRAPGTGRCACAGGGSSCRCHGNSVRAQTKVAVGPAGDHYEREADRIAARIVGGGHARVEGGSTAEQVSRLDAGTPAGTQVDLPSTSGGTPLSPSVRGFMEPRFGTDFGAVRVHTGQQAAATSREIGARAFTVGSNIWLGHGESTSDHGLMAHELTHVVQQGGAGADSAPSTAGPVAQRQMSCDVAATSFDLYAVNLPGSTRDPAPDVAKANSIWAQCNTTFNLAGGQSWQTSVLDTDAPANTLNAPSGTVRPLTAEETTVSAYTPGGASAIHVYYVPAFSGPKVAQAFWPTQHSTRAVFINNVAPDWALAHEVGHVLADHGFHDGDRDNLMAAGSVNTAKGHLRCDQCP